MSDFFKAFGHYWGRFGHFIGDSIGRIVLMFLYLTVVLPFAIIMQATGDRLDVRQPRAPAAWKPREDRKANLDEGYRQT